MFQIDLFDHTSYESFTREVVLDNVSFRLKFRYSNLKNFWTLEIQDINSNPIRIYKCICNFDIMIRDKANTNLPKGKLFFYTDDKTKAQVQKEDFQTKAVSLIYITEAEWQVMKG